MSTRRCGTCANFERARPYSWGHCIASLPMVIDAGDMQMETWPEADAADCPCWTALAEPEQKATDADAARD